jgi:two-component system response regulator NreC
VVTSSSNEVVDVMLVDARDVVREGLRALIDQQPDLVVVAEAAAVRDAGNLDDPPDVIVTDIDLPDAKHRDVISGLRGHFRQSSILVFTAIDHLATIQSVLDAGADGYLLETAATTDLLTGIRAVARGETYLQPALGIEFARWHGPRDTSPALSPKEAQVLQLLALGHTNVEVANLCGVSLRTVEKHRAQIQRKLGRRTRAELVQYAREVGLVPLDPS